MSNHAATYIEYKSCRQKFQSTLKFVTITMQAVGHVNISSQNLPGCRKWGVQHEDTSKGELYFTHQEKQYHTST